jgi:phospholipase/carboxylesterase
MDRKFAGLDVSLTGGSDGHGGGDGPLVVLLHGFGAPGTDLVQLGQYIAAPKGTRFAFPAAPLSLNDFGGGQDFGLMDSRAWWMIDMERLQRRLMGSRNGDFSALTNDVPEGLTEARQQLLEALAEMLRELAVPAGQLVLGGFSQGAMLSLDVTLRSALPLAGLLLMSGTLICAPEWQPLMPARRGLPVLQTHGRQDMLLPYSIAEDLRDHLQAAKLAVEFLPFSGGHEIPPGVLRAASVFLGQAFTRAPTAN